MVAKAPSRTVSIPAPTGGWDTRQSRANMPAHHAVILDNFFPETEQVTLRGGSASHATGLGGPVQTILEYTGTDGANEIFGCANGDIFDVSSAGAVGAAKVTGMTNNKWQFVNIGTSGGQFLLATNGQDTPRTYDGTTWGTFGATGPTVASLIWLSLHHRRLFFGEKDSLSFWYLAVNSITGSASEFPLHGLFKKGGYIMAHGTWTRDSGEGSDDLSFFITSEGEVAVYNGIDPSDAANWQLIGVFRIGRPIGRRCMIKSGADLVLITEDGYVPASAILAMDRAQAEKVAISKQINDAVNKAVKSYGSNFGWQPVLYPKGQMLIFNVPVTSTTANQHVFNTLTGAPCRFKGLDALCWGMKGDSIYFGKSDGTVWQFDKEGQLSDGGSAIEGDGLPAFNYFKMPGNKAFKLVEPIFESTGNPAPALDMNVDFQVKTPTGVATPSPSTSATWGVSKWGVGTWGTSSQIYRGWRGVRGIGRTGSLRIRVNSTTSKPSWLATNYTFIQGGQIR